MSKFAKYKNVNLLRNKELTQNTLDLCQKKWVIDMLENCISSFFVVILQELYVTSVRRYGDCSI